MKLKDVVIKNLGLITGRDAIKIAKISSTDPQRIEIIGSTASRLCSKPPDVSADFFEIKFIFDRVIMFNIKYDEIAGAFSDEEFEM
jgi:hypothetical protein